MGFFDVVGKLFKGEPVFAPPSQKPGLQANTPQVGTPPAPATGGQKVLPQVMIERWQCLEQGAGLQCEVHIRNYSNAGVILDRIEVLGKRDSLGYHLGQGESYEYHFNLQTRPRDAHLDECDIYFKNEAGDYFLAKHQVEFEKQPDGSFSILRFKLLPPIRDV